MVDECNSCKIFCIRDKFGVNTKHPLYLRVSSCHVYPDGEWGVVFKVWMNWVVEGSLNHSWWATLNHSWIGTYKARKDPTSSYMRERIHNHVFFSLFVNYLIVISQHFGKRFMLFWRWQWLIQKIFQTMVICFDLKMTPKKIRSPGLYCMEDGHHFFLIGGLA